MELMRVKNTSYARYEELLLKREQLYRESESILIAYTKEFGELITAVFEEKVECIRLKKAIAFCQMQMNRGETVDAQNMQDYLERNMAVYYAELKEMLDQNESARSAKRSTTADIQRAKKLYRKLAKLLHPDINPKTNEIPELTDLWMRIQTAYHGNNAVELSELEVLANKVIADLNLGVMEIDIPDIDLKIQMLEDEINQILGSEPYTYAKLLDDPGAVKEKKDGLQKELQDHQAYRGELDEFLTALMSGNGGPIIWKMN